VQNFPSKRKPARGLAATKSKTKKQQLQTATSSKQNTHTHILSSSVFCSLPSNSNYKMSRGEEDNNDEYIWRRSPFPNPPPPGSMHHHLEQYELSSLQCPCCHFLYDNAVSLRPCHHSFCNKCIRDNLSTRNGVKDKRECPVCKCKIELKKGNGATVKDLNDEEAIIPNYGLQVRNIFDYWLVIAELHCNWDVILIFTPPKESCR
jgi:hypothetical protein